MDCLRFPLYKQYTYSRYHRTDGWLKQVSQRATIAHLRAIINIWGLFRCSRTANSTVSGPIWLKFEVIQNIIYVIICKFKSIG